MTLHYLQAMGLNPFAATKCNIFTNGEAGCYSECVEPPKARYKLDTTTSRKMCCLLHGDSTVHTLFIRIHTSTT